MQAAYHANIYNPGRTSNIPVNGFAGMFKFDFRLEDTEYGPADSNSSRPNPIEDEATQGKEAGPPLVTYQVQDLASNVSSVAV